MRSLNIFKNWRKILSLILVFTFILPYVFSAGIIKAAPEEKTTDGEKYVWIISNQRCRLFYINECKKPTNFGDGMVDIDEALQVWYKEIQKGENLDAVTTAKRLSALRNACSSLEELTEEEYKQKIEFFLNADGGEKCISFLGLQDPVGVDWTKGSAQGDASKISDRCPIETIENKFSFTDFLNSPLDALMSALPALLTALITLILKLVVKVLLFFIVPNAVSLEGGGALSYTGFTVNNEFVTTSWVMIRDIANVLLMLILFVIALGIMLRRSEFKNYQALIYLVAVAILLNFSLVICGVLIDISNYFTLFFLNNGGIQNLECNLVMTIQRVSNIFNQGSPTWWQAGIKFIAGNAIKIITSIAGFVFGGPVGAGAGFVAGGWAQGLISKAVGIKDPFPFVIVISKMLGLIVSIVFLGQMIGLLLYVLVRILALWGLSIVSPIVFVCYILPQTRGIFKKWSQYFTGLLINLPLLCAAMFFILKLMNDLSKHANLLMADKGGSANVVPAILGYTIMIIALAQSLLIAASSLNVQNASKAANWVKGAAVAGTVWAFNAGKKETQTRLYNSETAKTAVSEWSKSSNPVVAGFARNINEKMAASTASSINTGYKEASKVTPEDYNAQFSLLKRYSSLGKNSEAFGVLKKMKENGNDEFAFIPSDLYADHPEYVAIVNNIARTNSHKDTKDFDTLKKSQVYLQFERMAGGKYNREKVMDKIKAIASDPTKYRDIDFDSLAIFLDSNKDENGEILGADKGLMAFFSTAGKTYGGIPALLKKPKLEKLNQFLTSLNEKLPAGKNIFSDLSYKELNKVKTMYETGKLSLIDQSHKDNLLNALKQQGFSINQETQVAQENIDKAKKSTNKNEQIEVMRQMLEELREMNNTKSAPKEKSNFWLKNFEQFAPTIQQGIRDSLNPEQKSFLTDLERSKEIVNMSTDAERKITVNNKNDADNKANDLFKTFTTLLMGSGPNNLPKSISNLAEMIENLNKTSIAYNGKVATQSVFNEIIIPKIETLDKTQLANLLSNLNESRAKQLIEVAQTAAGKELDSAGIKDLANGSDAEKKIYNKYFGNKSKP